MRTKKRMIKVKDRKEIFKRCLGVNCQRMINRSNGDRFCPACKKILELPHSKMQLIRIEGPPGKIIFD